MSNVSAGAPPPLPSSSSSSISHSNLFIKNVPPEVDEASLKALFEPCGQVESCRVLKSIRPDSSTIGFVKFATIDMAIAAIKEMNGAQISNTKLEVRMAQQDVFDNKCSNSEAKMPTDNLYVKGFPSHWGEYDLKMLFQSSGSVDACRILITREADKGGVGLVRMKSVEEATNAINMWNLKTPPGSHIILSVTYADTTVEKERKEKKKSVNKTTRFAPYQIKTDPVINQNIYPMTAAAAAAAANPLNPIQNYQMTYAPGVAAAIAHPQPIPSYTLDAYGMPIDPNTGQPTYITAAAAPPLPPPPPPPTAAAVAVAAATSYPLIDPSTYYASLMQTNGTTNGVLQDTTNVNVAATNAAVAAAGIQTPIAPSASLYIRNLPKEADKLYLYEMFALHGAIKSAAILKDDDGQCRGIGFVNFVEHASALRAIGALHGKKVGNVELQVSLQHKKI